MSDPSSTYTLTPQELATAKSTLKALQERVIIKVNLTRNSLSAQFRSFVEELVGISGKFQPIYTTHSEDGPPTIEIQPNLHYMAIPKERELVPFLESVIARTQGEILLAERTLSALETFIRPTKVEVVVSPTCPHCPIVVGLVNKVALASTYMEVTIIDGALFPDFIEKYGIRAVPTLIIEGSEQLVGEISEDLLVDKLTNQAPSTFHPDSFKKIVKEGDAEKLAGMMVADGDIYGVALELLADPDWSVRMGMMVVLEEVAQLSPDLVERVYPYLLELLEHDDANQRGDMAYLLGLIGNASVIHRLEMLQNDKNPEVAEAAIEAVGNIRKRDTVTRKDGTALKPST